LQGGYQSTQDIQQYGNQKKGGSVALPVRDHSPVYGRIGPTLVSECHELSDREVRRSLVPLDEDDSCS
jgi:hypothetical protein